MVQVAINAVALLVASLLVPGIRVDWGEGASGVLVALIVLAIVVGVVNAFLRPVGRLVAIPLNIATLGLFSLVLNASLLLAVAFLVDLAWRPLIVIGGFPPQLDVDALLAAGMGSLIISFVSTALNVLIPHP